MNKGLLWILFLIVLSPFILFASPMPEVRTNGKEIPNLVSAVKEANPGDYILLQSGKKYVFTKEEIEIAKGAYNYSDLSGVKKEIRTDKTEILTISESHTVYRYPDGQSTHLIKTGPSFTAFMKYIKSKYYLAEYIDNVGSPHDSMKTDPPAFNVFRASIRFQDISDGVDKLESVTITVYNYNGDNYTMKYIAQPYFNWGHVKGTYSPIGEAHEIEFDIE